MDARKQIVIIGANFGGLATAMRLSQHYAVTVIDPWPYFEFLPNIHELISGVKSPEQLRLSRRRLLQQAGHRWVRDTVIGLDPAARQVMSQSGELFSFDVCVVAIGGVNNTFGVPGADTFGLPFKSVEDCEAISSALTHAIERQPQSSVVIVGGGLEGIESLGEILRRYRRAPGLSIHVIESNDRLLPSAPAAIGREVHRICQGYPVQFHLNTRVTAVTTSSVELTSGLILPSDATIWTGGATAPPLLAEAGLAERVGSWAPVRRTLQSSFFESIFVIGDAAEWSQSLSKQAYYATDMGEVVADNIERFFQNRPLKCFQPSFDLSLIAFGDLDTYLVFGDTVIAGTVLAPAKEFIYQFNMARYEPPFSVMSFFDLQTRFWTGISELALPTLFSPASLLRLSQIRLL